MRYKYYYNKYNGLVYRISKFGTIEHLSRFGTEWIRSVLNQATEVGNWGVPLSPITVRFFEQDGGYRKEFLDL